MLELSAVLHSDECEAMRTADKNQILFFFVFVCLLADNFAKYQSYIADDAAVV